MSTTYARANRGANISLIGAFICFLLLGVCIGALYSNSIINFINSLI